MDESVINGANLFFPTQFGLVPPPGKGATREQWLIGLVNSAPAVSAGHILRHYVLICRTAMLCILWLLGLGPGKFLNHY